MQLSLHEEPCGFYIWNQASVLQMSQAGELSEALQDSLSILKENKSAKEFRQTMHLDSTDSNGQQEIEKVNTAVSQVISQSRRCF